MGARRPLRRRVQVSEILIDLRGHVSFGPPKTKASIRAVTLPRFRVRRTRTHRTARR
jgi:hypothetical protein